LGEKDLCPTRDAAIAGFALDGSKWDGLHLGWRKGGDRIYAGKVDQGFDNDIAKDLLRSGAKSHVAGCATCSTISVSCRG
jgi:hypothetical protein